MFWRLENLGCRGTASQGNAQTCVIRGYFHHEQVAPADLGELQVRLAQDAQSFEMEISEPQVTWQMIQEEDWAHAWKQYWHPQAIGDRLLINPAWLPEPVDQPSRRIIRLDPGVAFGTGSHPTTQLCLEALERRIPADSGLTIADIGCGSGILSIGAILLGAKQAYAVDLDPLAVSSTLENWQLNQLPPEQLWVKQGSVEQVSQIPGIQFDGIVCNILAPVIVELMPQLSAIAQPQTWMLLSGLLVSQKEAVVDAALRQGWQLTGSWNQNDWACLEVIYAPASDERLDA